MVLYFSIFFLLVLYFCILFLINIYKDREDDIVKEDDDTSTEIRILSSTS